MRHIRVAWLEGECWVYKGSDAELWVFYKYPGSQMIIMVTTKEVSRTYGP